MPSRFLYELPVKSWRVKTTPSRIAFQPCFGRLRSSRFVRIISLMAVSKKKGAILLSTVSSQVIPFSTVQKNHQLRFLLNKIRHELASSGFSITENRLQAITVDRYGNPANIPIANFVFWPEKEFIVEGADQSAREYEVRGLLLDGLRALKPIRLTANQLGNDRWINSNWGIDPRIKPKMYQQAYGIFHLLRHFRKQVRLFKETGWHKLGQDWAYIHAGGAIGNMQPNKVVRGDFSEPIFSRYSLPACCANPSQAASVMQQLLEIGSPGIAYPMAAMIWLPPLAELFRQQNHPVGFVAYLKGSSGCGKSSLAALALSAFGDMDKQCFPASFRDTLASTEQTFATLKDSLCVVDDYHPREKSELRAMNDLADSIGRMVADGNSRGRSNQKKLRSQAIVLATGELVPSIAPSGLSRFLFIECNAADLDYTGKFKDAMKTIPLLRQAMQDFIAWIAANWDRVGALIDTAFQNHFAFFSKLGDSRSVTAVSHMASAMEIGLAYLKERGQVDEPALQDYRCRLQQVFTDILRYNLSLQTQSKPADAFLDSLQCAINCSDGLLFPTTCKTYQSKAIGCFDDENIYLRAEKSYALVVRTMRGRNLLPLPPAKEVWRELAKNGILSTKPDSDRNTMQRRLPALGKNNTNTEVLVIARKFVPDLSL